MPSTTEKFFQSVPGLERYGAGEPRRAGAPAWILDGVPDEIRRQLPDELVDELLAGAKSEEEM